MHAKAKAGVQTVTFVFSLLVRWKLESINYSIAHTAICTECTAIWRLAASERFRPLCGYRHRTWHNLGQL
jgi:hypothetical protein